MKKDFKTMAIIALGTISILLTGCHSKEIEQDIVIGYEVKSSNEIESSYESINENDTEVMKEVEVSSESKVSDVVPVREDDKALVNSQVNDNRNTEDFTYFKNAKEQLKEDVARDKIDSVRSKGKEYVITGIDFIFYDKPINGVYFKDMTDEVKRTVIRDVEIIDGVVMEYYPDYKENISSKYRIAADFLSEKYIDILDKIKEYLGSENYEAIGEIKNQVVSDIKDKKDEAVDYIKNKYDDWKKKN